MEDNALIGVGGYYEVATARMPVEDAIAHLPASSPSFLARVDRTQNFETSRKS